MRLALLPDRSVIALSGPDTHKLLQGIVTNDVQRLGAAPALHAGLLSAQGKILFDFFIVAAADGVLIETARASAAALKQRLEMYKLRAAVDIRDAASDYSVAAAWDIGEGEGRHSAHTIVFPDPRHPRLGNRYLASLASNWRRDLADAEPATRDDYDAHRVALGVAEAGSDFPLGDTFPHEANYDLTGSVSFRKGCYVGQEVVSRMQHKTVVRKRVVRIGGGALATGGEVRAGEAVIGRIGTVAGEQALALLRIDRVAEALDKAQPLTAGGGGVSVDAEAVERYRRSVAERPQSA